jgi:hypothetical protein
MVVRYIYIETVGPVVMNGGLSFTRAPTSRKLGMPKVHAGRLSLRWPFHQHVLQTRP